MNDDWDDEPTLETNLEAAFVQVWPPPAVTVRRGRNARTTDVDFDDDGPTGIFLVPVRAGVMVTPRTRTRQ